MAESGRRSVKSGGIARAREQPGNQREHCLALAACRTRPAGEGEPE